MSQHQPTPFGSLPAESSDLVYQFCDQFEAAWRAGENPRIEDFVERAAEPVRAELLADLLAIELELRTGAGQRPLPVDYHGRFAEAVIGVAFATRPAGTNLHETGDPAKTQRAEFQPGTVVAGRYKLLEEIGEGGMGTVWVAEQTQPFRRKVALKLIKAGMDSKAVLARFEAERQALAVMDHPNIAKVLDGGLTETGRPFFVMEYVKGMPITEYCEATRMSIPERLQLFVQVCHAVQHAHQKGIIHRDLKPSNILVAPFDDRPVPKVIDFGLAKALHQSLTERTLHTAHETVIGTPLYMSPEQAQLNNLDVDTRSDLFSLGVLLYELLTGSTPLEKQRFKEAAWEEIRRIIREEEPPRPSTRLSSSETLPSLAVGRQMEPAQLTKLVRGDLDWIVMKALEKDRARRYDTASGFAMDVQRYLAGESVLAAPPSARYRLRKFARKHRAALLAAAAMILLLLAGTALSTWQAVRAMRAEAATSRALEVSEFQKGRAEEALAGETAARRDAESQRSIAQDRTREALAEKNRVLRSERSLYASRIVSAQRDWENNDVASAWNNLNACAGDLRGWEHDYLYTLFSKNQRTFQGHRREVRSVAFSPDGKRIVSGSGPWGNALKVWDAASGQEVFTLIGGADGIWSVAFSPDGKRIVSASGDTMLKVWDAASGQEVLTLRGHAAGVHSVAFSPDGTRIASGDMKGELKVWDAASGQENLALGGHTGGIHGLAFSPDGKRLASAGDDKELTIWDLIHGQKILTLHGHTSAIRSVAFSPDGMQIAAGADFGTAKVWNTATGEEIITLKCPAGTFHPVAFSRDGKWIVTGCGDGKVMVWDAADGRELLALQGHTAQVCCVTFSPDGRQIASGGWDKSLKVWDLDVCQEILTLRTNRGGFSVAFSPDGRQIAAGCGGSLRFWDVATGKEVFEKVWDAASGKEVFPMRSHTGAIHCLAFNPDGKRVASGDGGGALMVWDAASGREMRTLQAHIGRVLDVAFDPDGKRMVSGGDDGAVKVWDAVNGQEIFTLRSHTGRISGVAYSPDGKRIASASGDHTLKVWDATGGQEILTLRGHTGGVASVVYSPDGKRIVSGGGGDDPTLRIWDAASGQKVFTLVGHTDTVSRVAFSADGKRIVSGSEDTNLKVWDAAIGLEILTLRGHSRLVRSLAFSPDGRRIASNSWDGTIRIWDATRSQPVEVAPGEILEPRTDGGSLVDSDGKWKLPPGAPSPAVAPFDAGKAKAHQAAWAKHLSAPVEISNSIGMKLVLIPPGEFMMGSPKELIEAELKTPGVEEWYKQRLKGEGPQHLVRITKPYYLGVCHVTQEEYQRVMEVNPSRFSATGFAKDKVAGQDTKWFPVESVSWHDASAFCDRLSKMPAEKAAERRYRLPTDAQWEYACRAGSTGRFSFGSDRGRISTELEEQVLLDYGWFNRNAGGLPHEVGRKRASAWGLHDMHGNIWQWCWDGYDSNYYSKSLVDDPAGAGGTDRVIRGGSCLGDAKQCRAAMRLSRETGVRDGITGFRVCLVLTDK